jgi:hypothetical protein
MNRFFIDFNPDPAAADPEAIDFDGILTYQATRTNETR